MSPAVGGPRNSDSLLNHGACACAFFLSVARNDESELSVSYAEGEDVDSDKAARRCFRLSVPGGIPAGYEVVGTSSSLAKISKYKSVRIVGVHSWIWSCESGTPATESVALGLGCCLSQMSTTTATTMKCVANTPTQSEHDVLAFVLSPSMPSRSLKNIRSSIWHHLR